MNLKRLEEKIEIELLLEKKKEADIPKAGSDARGKLHELLVGYHINGGQHMEKFKDKDGESPQQAHDRIKSTLHPKEYSRIHDAAKLAAENLRSEHARGKLVKVRWTSKPGDIKRATGIESSQTEDASDIIITTRNKGKIRHHGISLKVSDKPRGDHHIGTSNPGLESTYGGREFHEKHKAAILKAHPALASLGSKKLRKEWMVKNAKAAAQIKSVNKKVLHHIAAHTAAHMSKKGTKFIADHVRTHILKTHMTPMQRQGHVHLRHVSYLRGGKREHHALDPSTHWEHLLKDHKNLSVEQKGTTIHFKHAGKTFATHRMKFESQSDPMSSIKGFGNSHGSHEPTHQQKRKATTKRIARRVGHRRKAKKNKK